MNIRKTEQPLALTLAKTTEDYAKTLLGFFARAPVSMMVQIMKAKRANYNRYGRNWAREHPKKDLHVELACFLMACREIYAANRSLKYKDGRGREEILKADRLMSELRREQASISTRRPRRKAKLDAINVRLPLIIALREKECSWREISAYLEMHAGLTVTHTYLRESVLMLGGPISDPGSEE
jgi:hypothetical protein